MAIYDISLPVDHSLPTYPGDPGLEFESIIKPSGTRLTRIAMGSHVGTHIDAPSHSIAEGEGVGVFPLECFYGVARVIEIMGESIDRASIQNADIRPGERVLFKTSNSARGYDRFYNSWVGMEADAAEYLAEIGVRLVGVDWFGIKCHDAPDNRAHTALLGKGVPILEGLNLANITEGEYTLSALPVAMYQLDGAPVRAVLLR